MFDNLLFQSASGLLKDDIASGRLPGAVLFCGPSSSGKLTAALETARVLSCTENPRGRWSCSCSSCLRHKALVSPNLMLLGPRDCSLEIQAAQKAFVSSVSLGDSHVNATRYLFLRSVRKLQNRFNPALWQDSDKLNKIAVLTGELDERMEEIDVGRELPDIKAVEENVQKIVELCKKLEGDFMYDSVPILQIRNLSVWARIGAASGTKVIVIERAERMLEGVRNALLKILEEPPANTLFILTAERKSAVMPTILSRLRPYPFSSRTSDEEKEIIDRVFHDGTVFMPSNGGSVIQHYLEGFLPVRPEIVEKRAADFFDQVFGGQIPDVADLVKACGKFEPRVLLKIFLTALEAKSRELFSSASGVQKARAVSAAARNVWLNVSTYNQNVQSALEELLCALARERKR
ncbi:MAG: DNA polymerase III [Treponema sp.]|nr:DNA polymerase III [Treponema sp.]